MPMLPLQIPPGLFRNGTRYQGAGRWIDGNLVRWHESTMRPVGNWEPLGEGSSGGAVDLAEIVAGMHSWRGNDGIARLALGTPEKAYAYVEGALTDITPAAFTTGGGVATSTTGQYGSGAYGAGLYGEGDPGIVNLTEAQSWQFDAFGQILVATAYSDGRMLSWDLNTSNDLAVIANAPTDVEGLVVTPERFLVALGKNGDGRVVAWADQQTLTTWTPATTNQAGDFPLATQGTLLAGRRGRGETLLWTTRDLWSMQFIGGTLVYSFRMLGAECGAISRRAMTVVGGGMALWMGRRNFFVYDGHVRSLPSEVGDYVFGDINRFQSSLVHAVTISEFNEVWWFYPSRTSDVVNRYVTYNYAEGHWTTGTIGRSAGVDRGAFDRPIMAAPSGKVFVHEAGSTKLDPAGNTIVPFAESGPIELGAGDTRMWIRQVIPDERTLGDVAVRLRARGYPTEAAQLAGPFPAGEPTLTRVSGRQVELRLDQVSDFWRVGNFRLEVVPAEQR